VSAAAASADSAWTDAMLAAAAFAVDPGGLGGLSVRSRPGPARDRYLALLGDMLPAEAPVRRVPPFVADGRLLGGLDLAATLRAGRPVVERGLLAEADGGVVLVPMAERLPASTVAHLAACLDSRELALERDGFGLRVPACFGVVAMDEGIDDERPAPALADRLAFHVDFETVEGETPPVPDRRMIEAARSRMSAIETPDSIIEALCAAASALGIESARAPLFALRAARAVAALEGRAVIERDNAAVAARLVLAPRATRLPQPPDAEPPPEPEPQEQAAESSDAPSSNDPDRPLDDVVLAAARAAIPKGLLASLKLGGPVRMSKGGAGKSGAQLKSVRRGRPAGVRRGEPRGGARLNLVETLRAAAPWQRMRGGGADPHRVSVRPEDFRVTRLKQPAQTTTVFVVDASGSTALNRLAEAKGAIELLLADCYVRRDQVALIAFRGTSATLLLPPTRSLARAKRCLASLPGGGGTPLASGLEAAAALCHSIRRQGRTPVVIVMTDGRGNVDRAGRPGRANAASDATAAARLLRDSGAAAMVVDTAPKPQETAARLAMAMGSLYLPLPHADAAALSRNVGTATRLARAGRSGTA
jgi:magnesium chelatase subunit D